MSAKTQPESDVSTAAPTDLKPDAEVYESALKPLLWILGIPVALVVLVKIFV